MIWKWEFHVIFLYCISHWERRNLLGKYEYTSLTLGFEGDDRLVVKAENLRDIVEIGMLDDESPLRVVKAVIEVCNRNLGAPILLVVKLHMPMHSDRAHVLCALKQWGVVLRWCVQSHHT